MALIELKRDPTLREVRQFAFLVLPGLALVLAAVAVLRYDSWRVAGLFLAGGAVSVLLGAVQPRWMRFAFLAWMWAAFPLGWVVSHVAMGAIYFLMITPLGVIMRACGRDPLGLKFDRQAKSYWTPRETEVDPARYFRQF
jgi:hypothetical protein